jgi:ribosomal protein L21
MRFAHLVQKVVRQAVLVDQTARHMVNDLEAKTVLQTADGHHVTAKADHLEKAKVAARVMGKDARQKAADLKDVDLKAAVKGLRADRWGLRIRNGLSKTRCGLIAMQTES